MNAKPVDQGLMSSAMALVSVSAFDGFVKSKGQRGNTRADWQVRRAKHPAQLGMSAITVTVTEVLLLW